MNAENDMKRSGRRPDQAKRNRILLAAQEIFSERGFTATSMNAVAERAAVSKLTAYRHFGSKDELFTAAVTARCETMLAGTSETPTQSSDARDALIAFGRAFLALILHAEAIAIHRLIVAEQDRAPQLGPLFHSAAIQPTQQRLAALILHLKIDVDEPSFAATDLLALWRGKPMLLIEMGMPGWTTAEIDAHVVRTVDLCLAGWQQIAQQSRNKVD